MVIDTLVRSIPLIDEAKLLGIQVVGQWSVELDKLVHHLFAHQNFAKNQVWVVDPDKLKGGGVEVEGQRNRKTEGEIKMSMSGINTL